jgi:hypothetical protein
MMQRQLVTPCSESAHISWFDGLRRLGVAGSAASVAGELSAAEAVLAFGLNYAAAVANVAFNNTFLGCQFPFAFALIAIGGQRPSPVAFGAFDLTLSTACRTNQVRKHLPDSFSQ